MLHRQTHPSARKEVVVPARHGSDSRSPGGGGASWGEPPGGTSSTSNADKASAVAAALTGSASLACSRYIILTTLQVWGLPQLHASNTQVMTCGRLACPARACTQRVLHVDVGTRWRAGITRLEVWSELFDHLGQLCLGYAGCPSCSMQTGVAACSSPCQSCQAQQCHGPMLRVCRVRQNLHDQDHLCVV